MLEKQIPKSRRIYHAAIISFILGLLSFIAFILLYGQFLLLLVPSETALSLSELLSKTQAIFLNSINPRAILLFPLLPAVGAIAFGHITRRKIKSNRFAGNKLALAGLSMGYVSLPLHLVALGLGSLVASEFWGCFDDFDRAQQPWVQCAIELPDGSGQVVFMRRNAHPFLAEYDRRIRLETLSFGNVVRALPMNVGGRTKINVYWYPEYDSNGPFLSLKDHWGTYYIDLQRAVVMTSRDKKLGDIFPTTGGQYLGRLDGTQGPLCFVTENIAPEEQINPSD